jgi:MFS family permease
VDADDDRRSEREPEDLDDVADRSELRGRYEILLQELRVVLPGVQVLMAFLLTAPFAQRFGELDDVGKRSYLAALISALASTVFLLAPTVFHRVADRRARRLRVVWGVRLVVTGVVLLAVALTAATWCITRLVFGTTTATLVAAGAAAAFLLVWVALPVTVGRSFDNNDGGAAPI